MDALKKFGKLIRERRRKLGLSQEKLAELSGLSTRQVVRIEKGIGGNITFMNLIRLCIECEIEIGELEQFWTSPYDDISYDEIWSISVRSDS